MRNATCAASKTSKVPTRVVLLCILILCHRFALVLNLDEAVTESGNSDPEMHITQSSPQRKRTFPTLVVLCEDTLAPDEDIWALAGDINEVEEQPSATGFDRFAAPESETEVRAKIDDCVPKSTRYKDKWAVALL